MKLHSFEEVLRWPPPKWLVRDVLEAESLVLLYGAEGTKKTYLTLDLAMHIATGCDWHGHSVKQGGVVYVVGEGCSGVSQRILAYQKYYDLKEAPPIVFHHGGIDILAKADDLIDAIEKTIPKPKLIVFDTLARCYSGEENSNKEMGQLVVKLDRLKMTTGATVLLVHHSNKNNENRTSRGASALPGAVDVMIEVSSKGGMTVSCKKMKNAPPFKPKCFALKAVPVPGGFGDAGVLVPREPDEKIPMPNLTDVAVQKAVESFGASGAKRADVIRRVRETASLGESAIEKALKRLVDSNQLTRSSKGWYVPVLEQPPVPVLKADIAAEALDSIADPPGSVSLSLGETLLEGTDDCQLRHGFVNQTGCAMKDAA